MKLPIYLDYNATTPVDPTVLAEMIPFFSEHFGNSGSKTHAFGWKAGEAVDRARGRVAQLLSARPADIVFTSGATESDNMAILGVAAAQPEKRHIISCTIEHKAILDPLTHLESHGYRITRLRPDPLGRISPDQVEQALSADTLLVSLMRANNEIGTVHPIDAISKITRDRGVLLHTDAAQAVGKIEVDVDQLGVDLLSLSGHKLYAPKGIGVLYVRPKTPISPIMFGGGQERSLRPGTSSVPLIVGLGAACHVFDVACELEMQRIAALRDRLVEGLQQRTDCVRNGDPDHSLPGTAHLSFPRVESDALLMAVNDIALSSGAACTSAKPEPSYVLRGLGLEKERLFSSVRFGVGRFSTEDEIEYAIERVSAAVQKLRGENPR